MCVDMLVIVESFERFCRKENTLFQYVKRYRLNVNYYKVLDTTKFIFSFRAISKRASFY